MESLQSSLLFLSEEEVQRLISALRCLHLRVHVVKLELVLPEAFVHNGVLLFGFSQQLLLLPMQLFGVRHLLVDLAELLLFDLQFLLLVVVVVLHFVQRVLVSFLFAQQ